MRVRNVVLLAVAVLALLVAARAARDDGDEVVDAVKKATDAASEAKDEVQEVAERKAEAIVKQAAATTETVDPNVAKVAAVAADAQAGAAEALKRGARDAAARKEAADTEGVKEMLKVDKAEKDRAIQMDALDAAANKMEEKLAEGDAPAPQVAERPQPPVAKVEEFTAAKMRQAEMEIGSVFSGVISSMVTNILTQNPDIVRRALIVKQMKLAADAAAAAPAS